MLPLVPKNVNWVASVKNAPRSRRPKTATNDDPRTQLVLSENRRSVGRILKKKKLKLSPYKVHLLQEHSEDDFDSRLEF